MIRELMLDLRSLVRRPLFVVATVAMLSLGIGATTAVYSLVDGVLLTPLAFRQPDRLVTVQLVVPEMRERFPATPVSIAVVDAWRRGCERTCRELGTVGATEVILSGEGAPELLSGARVTPGFFELLGVEPLLGRDFGVDDGGVGTRIAMLTYGLWQRRYGGDPSVLGRVITLDEQAVEVVGNPSRGVPVSAIRGIDTDRGTIGSATVLRAASVVGIGGAVGARIRLRGGVASAAGRNGRSGRRRAERYSGGDAGGIPGARGSADNAVVRAGSR